MDIQEIIKNHVVIIAYILFGIISIIIGIIISNSGIYLIKAVTAILVVIGSCLIFGGTIIYALEITNRKTEQ